MNVSDSHHFRKMVAGACMVAAPLFALIAFVIAPRFETDEAARLGVIADNAERFFASSMLGLVAIVLSVPVVLGLMHMLRERRVAFGHIGGALGLIGLLALAMGIGADLAIWQMAAGGVDASDVALLERMGDTAGVVIPLFLLPFAFAAGYAVLAIGLFLARAVDWWMAALIAIGPFAIVIAFVAGLLSLAIIGAALLLVGLGAVGLMVLRESDADWEHTPKYRGFRPAAGMS